MPDRLADAVTDADGGRARCDRDRDARPARPATESHAVAATHAGTDARADGKPDAGADAESVACTHPGRERTEGPDPHAAVRRTAEPHSAAHHDACCRRITVTIEFSEREVELAASNGVTVAIAMCLPPRVEAEPL